MYSLILQLPCLMQLLSFKLRNDSKNVSKEIICDIAYFLGFQLKLFGKLDAKEVDLILTGFCKRNNIGLPRNSFVHLKKNDI